MVIGNNYMVSVKAISGIWHNEYFIDERSARGYANDQWASGVIIVILYERSERRGEWVEISRAVTTEGEAMAKRTAHIASLASKIPCVKIEHR